MTSLELKTRAAKINRLGRSVLTLNRGKEYRNLLQMLELGPRDAVLDVGSGDGFWTTRFARQCAGVVGVEPDQRMVALARSIHHRRNVHYVRAFAESLPFATASFDKVVSVSCLEHFSDPLRGLREMARVVKPGGRLAFSVDSLLAENSPSSFRTWHQRRHFVTNYFNVSTLMEMMRSVGIRGEPDRTIHLFRSRRAARLRQAFIRNPRLWLPAFPLLYGLVHISDRMKDEMHGQIVIVTGTNAGS